MDEDVIYVVHGRTAHVFATKREMVNHVFHVDEYSDEDCADVVEVVARDGEVVGRLSPYESPLSEWVSERRLEQDTWVAMLPRTSACIELDGKRIETFTGVDGPAKARAKVKAFKPYLGERIVWREVV